MVYALMLKCRFTDASRRVAEAAELAAARVEGMRGRMVVVVYRQAGGQEPVKYAEMQMPVDA